MKLSKFFLMGVIAIGLVACNNEEVGGIDPNAPEATISVRIAPSSGTTVRAVGDISGDGVLAAGLASESVITSLEVYVFAGQTPNGYKKATATEPATVTQVLDIETSSGNKDIIVVANANIGSVASKDALLAKTKDLPAETPLIMTGQASATLKAGNNQYGFSTTTPNYNATYNQISANTPLKIERINARVAIVSAALNLSTAQKAIFDNLKEIDIAMFNVPKTSKLFGASLFDATGNKFSYGGAAWPSTSSTYTADDPQASLLNTNIGDAPAGTSPFILNTAAPYYYVNENTSTDAKKLTFIVLRGKPYKGDVQLIAEGVYTDANGYSYYPVWVNKVDDNYTYNTGHTADGKITRNTQYNITLSITKIGNPSIDPTEVAKLDVQVEVKPWTVVSQAVTW